MAPLKSQVPALALDSNSDWTALPLRRFSHAHSPRGAGKHHWVHESARDELFLVFRPVRESIDGGYRSTVRMIVYAGAEVLEDQDVGLLVDIASHYEKIRQLEQVDAREEAPVRVVVKCPCIAFRLPAEPKALNIRRIQVAFKTDADYHKAVEICSQLKLPVESNIKSTASQASHAPSFASSSTLRQQILSTASISSTMQLKSPYQSQGLDEPSKPLSRPLSVADFDFIRSHSTSSETMRPDSVLSLSSPLEARTFDKPRSLLRQNSAHTSSSIDGSRSFDNPSSLHRQSIVRPSLSTDILQNPPLFIVTNHENVQSYNTSSPSSSLIPQFPKSSSPSVNIQAHSSPKSRSAGTHLGLSGPSSLPRSHTLDCSINSANNVGSSTSLFVSQAMNMSHVPETKSSIGKTPAEPTRLNDIFSSDQWLNGLRHLNGKPSSSDSSQLAEIPCATPKLARFPSSSGDAVHLKRSATASEENKALSHDLELGNKHSLPESFRPMSAPALNQHDWMPPRRELPFAPGKKASSRPSTADIPSVCTQPSSKAQREGTAMPPANEEASTSAPKKATKRATQTKVATKELVTRAEVQTRNDQEEPSPLAAKSAAITRLSTAPGLPSKSAVGRKRPANSVIEYGQPSKQARQTKDQSTQTQTLSGRDHTVAIENIPAGRRTISSAPEETLAVAHTSALAPAPIPTPAPASTSSQPIPANFVAQIEAMVSEHSIRAGERQKELWERPRYADASPEDRQAMINDFICENLENEEFLTLCEDTNEVWRRIQLAP